MSLNYNLTNLVRVINLLELKFVHVICIHLLFHNFSFSIIFWEQYQLTLPCIKIRTMLAQMIYVSTYEALKINDDPCFVSEAYDKTSHEKTRIQMNAWESWDQMMIYMGRINGRQTILYTRPTAYVVDAGVACGVRPSQN